MHCRRTTLVLIAACAAAAAASTPSLAADAAANYPNRPLRYVLPNAPGSNADLFTRVIAKHLGDVLGQQVIVDSRPGAGGMLGIDIASKATPDGYTIARGNLPALAIAPHVYTKLPYSPTRDLTPVTLLGTADIMVVVNPTRVPSRNIRELIAHAKSNPGKLSFASGGNGSISHLLGDYFKSMAKVDMVHVPYKGDAQMVTDLIGGQVDIAFGTAVAFLPHLKSGKLVGIAVTNPVRSLSMPNLPTVAEAGVPGYEAVQWFGIVAPQGTPDPVVKRLNTELRAVLAMPDVRARFAELGFDVVGNSVEEFAGFIRSEAQKGKKIAEISGAKLD